MILALLLLAAPDLSGMLKLSDDSGSAHACPIAMDKALTSKHVMAGNSEVVWGVGDGEEFHGLLKVDWQDNFRDLAYVVPISEQRFPRWYSIAKSAPKIGEKVYFLGYDFRKAKDAYAPLVFEGKVTQVFTGMLAFDPEGKPGTSGSCVLNEGGEVLAINQGATELDANQGRVGQAVAVWGSWLLLKKDEPTVVWQEASQE